MKRWIRALNVVAVGFLAVCQGMAQTAPAATPTPGNDYSFTVSTSQPWTDTGVELQAGDVLEITAGGTQKCDPLGVSGASASRSSRGERASGCSDR